MVIVVNWGSVVWLLMLGMTNYIRLDFVYKRHLSTSFTNTSQILTFSTKYGTWKVLRECLMLTSLPFEPTFAFRMNADRSMVRASHRSLRGCEFKSRLEFGGDWWYIFYFILYFHRNFVSCGAISPLIHCRFVTFCELVIWSISSKDFMGKSWAYRWENFEFSWRDIKWI